MPQIKLRPRLHAVANLVFAKHKVADIGSDHAYLAAFLVEQGHTDAAIVGEVAKGPLENAKHTVAAQSLGQRIDCRLADGLAAIRPEDGVESVVIAGMGGLLIKKILNDQRQLGPFKQLVLQPNTDQDALRAWLVENDYAITKEEMVKEGVHRYEIIVAEPGKQTLSEADLTFGPFLRLEKGPIFLAKWTHEKNRLQLVLDRLAEANQQTSTKYLEVKEMIDKIEKELAEK
ncbi:tRNA (adenine(22)-N(1))-methyltransferase TrmK [Fructobacillus sp. M1-13]|uniref:tRNA (Adenine-N(1))-methyltransferase n=1 Tax=Fructobacillus papyriferae TaxID=2713171 RepID=A0ABS5QNL4_9LACO|nr:tRNA (adenine(22)-N(1))-methyltransferase TrmK [Fructobacillus papyriferae]MBS9334719.1 tRNA (adenine-N(1))-methyltransferase [Fructobacillus papyriferae]MCD2158709.1 tRNA (adenine(22)-N(1))-methyltransferase TrmK [Fructobacillus papyriferae]